MILVILALFLAGCTNRNLKGTNDQINNTEQTNDNIIGGYLNNPDESQQQFSSIRKEINPQEYKFDIFISNGQFMPNELHIKPGSEVTWTNQESVNYIIETDDGMFESDNLGNGDMVVFRFDNPGTYKYHAKDNSEMTGKIIVE